jgi:cytochrome c biogenesis factor
MSTFLATSLIPFGINLLSALVLVLLIYHAKSGRRDYVFTFLLVSTTIFVLCNTLFHVEMNLAFALGLFAVFGKIGRASCRERVFFDV